MRAIRHLFPILLLTLTLPVAASDDAPEFTYDGLQLVQDTKADLVYVRPGADFSGYEGFLLAAPGVAFRKNWERDLRRDSARRIDAGDVRRIREDVSSLFFEVFSERLREGGLKVVTDGGEGVLILLPAIVDLDISAPDVPSATRSRTYTTSAGEATLVLELHDSVTGQLLARAVDHQRARETPSLRWASAASNRQDARRAFRQWADWFVEGLREVQDR